MATIYTAKGEAILVDDELYPWLGQWAWRVNKQGYAFRRYNSGSRTVVLHQLIMGESPRGLVTDHLNRNKLDNRRSNLRFVTPLENARNTYQYLGGSVCVRWRKPRANHGERTGCWEAYLESCGKRRYVGRARTRDEAYKLCWLEQAKTLI